jgi:hypothetical protein
MIVTTPRLAEEASGMLKVTAVVDVAMLKSVPDVPVAKTKVVVARPLIEVVENATGDGKPRVEVATHLVDVPVVWSTMPVVPEALVVSRSAPVMVRLVVVAFVAVKLVKNAVVALRSVAKKLEEVAFVVTLLVIVSLVAYRLVVVTPVVDALPSTV